MINFCLRLQSRFFLKIIGMTGLLLSTAPASFANTSGNLPILKIAAISIGDPSVWTIEYMKEKGIDKKNGFDLQYNLKPVSVAYSEFVNGTDQVCMCLTIGTAARFVLKGLDASLVSTYSNYANSYLVTENKDIQKPQDIIGHSVAGSTGSGSWVFQQYILREHQNIDLSKVTIPSIVASAQIANLIAQRVDAITAYDDTRLKLNESQPGRFRFIPTFDKDKWYKLTQVRYIPMFFLGVRKAWNNDPQNHRLLVRFDKAYRESLAEIKNDPAAAAKILGSERVRSSDDYMVKTLTTLGDADKVVPATDLRTAISVLTRSLLPDAGLLDRPLTDSEVDSLITPLTP
ncbi:ABC transporter substrate-binding protein [Brenneria corticis]|uniref:SsuA/THI5-like domain-containing protein n=1 Tax=Brenneria corticis TaxID=2173106 RepID=A0A2U1UCY0_9GAMM|nr:ABC transporter substrate-binding protein [Brenneria sp. CFCC 11842]PWC19536.1 hypothetical protein DDT56_00755 [Brenneria sp. CFCC 11842]